MSERLTDEALRALLTQATRGPWTYGYLESGGSIRVVPPWYSDDLFCNPRIIGADGHPVAGLEEYRVTRQFVDVDEQDEDSANLLLMVAAPTLAAEVLELRARVAELEARNG